MSTVELLIGVLTVTMPLVALARRVLVPYPVVLVLGGLALSFIPGLPSVELDPNLVFVIFLPPLLYWTTVTAPTDDIRVNAAWVWGMGVGLVLATAFAIAAVARYVVVGMSGPIAAVLGAIVAPTDEIAVVPTLERFRIPRRLIAIIQGESLVNDAVALVLYATALAAVISGTFSWSTAPLRFALVSLGGVALGVVLGRIAVELWRRFDDSQVQLIISVVLPYLTYGLAQRLGLSGVFAVVAEGVYVNRFTPVVVTPTSRLQATGFWESVVFLSNVVIYLLVGLQLHRILATLARYPVTTLVWAAFAVNAAVIAVRFAWVFVQGSLPWFRGRRPQEKGELVVLAWCGLRGGISLAAALAIPTAGGDLFAERDLLIFLTFSVILVTLVGGALTLPLTLRRMTAWPYDPSESEERHARRVMAEAALTRIDECQREGWLQPEIAEVLRRRYRREHDVAVAPEGSEVLDASAQVVQAAQDVLSAKRAALIALRNRGEIDNIVLRRLQLGLDIEHAQLESRL